MSVPVHMPKPGQVPGQEPERALGKPFELVRDRLPKRELKLP